MTYGAAYLVAELEHVDVGNDLRFTRVDYELLPLPLYAGTWVVVGVVCLLGMFSRTLFRLAYSALSALMFVWAALNLSMFFLLGDVGLGALVSSALWGTMGIMTWGTVVDEQTAVKLTANDKAKAHAVDLVVSGEVEVKHLTDEKGD